MRILLVSDSDDGTGAQKAAYRLLCALRLAGHECRMLVRRAVVGDDRVEGPGWSGRLVARCRPRIDRLPLWKYPDREASFFSCAWFPDGHASRANAWRPEVVHLHWINNGMMATASVRRFAAPVVWTMHDSWAFTGGCHYHVDCCRFTAACGCCPVLRSADEQDLSHRIWLRKQRDFAGHPQAIIAPSTWMANRVRTSALFGARPVAVIPNALDVMRFRLRDRTQARAALGLPAQGRLIMFGAMFGGQDRNKGLHHLIPALRELAKRHSDVAALMVGQMPAGNNLDAGMPVHATGLITAEERMALAYSAADVVVVPSECENLPYAVAEAQACGVVPVAFRVGGIPDLIVHRHSGWLAEPFHTDDLAAGLGWALSDQAPSPQTLVALAERCAMPVVAEAHLAFYRRAMAGPSSTTPDHPPCPSR